METKLMQVYYDSSAYPFKDQARETRYPVIGTSFTGASNTTRIRFYVNQFANIGTCTFVAITKLPSGKKLYEQLSKDTTSDTEPFVYLDISSAYTQEKGDIQIALNVYEGGVNIVVDSESGLYSVSGSPIITATGNIKISVAYTPYMETNYGSVPTISVQQALALVSGKLDETSAIVVVDDTDNISASVFANGQMVYDKSTDIFYQVVSGEYVKQTLVDIAYEYAPSGSDVILTIKLSDGLGVYKTLTINLTTYLASLTYVNAQLNTKVDRLSTSGLHAYTHNGSSQGEIEINAGAVGGTLPIRNANGQIIVPLTPTENNHATSKKYTDDNLNLKADKSTTYTKTEVNNLIDSVKSGEVVLVNITTYPTLQSFLASTGVEGTIYLYPINTSDLSEGYYRYVWETISGSAQWVNLGTTEIDLSDYYTKTQVDNLLSVKANTSDVYTKTETNDLLSDKQDTLVSGTNIKTINNTTLLGSGNYAFDSAFNELSTNALENQVVAKEFREINYEIAMIREALFEVVLSEIDYSVDYAMTYVVPDTLSDTDGTHRVVYSETQLVSISGNSVVDNQLIGANDTEVTLASGGSYLTTIGGTSAITSGTGQTLQVVGGTDMAVDLKKAFPTNTPNSLNDNRIKWLLSLGCIAYNTGSLLSTSVSGLESIGLNQWDEEWEQGDVSRTTGQNIYAANEIRSKNYIPVIPNTTYYEIIGNSKSIRVLCYDVNKNYIYINPDGLLGDFPSGRIFTTPSNCYFIRITTRNGYGTTYNHDICINISNANVNGTYKPYSKHTITLPTTELKSAGSVHDYLEIVEGNVVEGEQRYNLVKHTLVGARAYSSGDESDTSVITDLTNTNYALATEPTPTTIATDLTFEQVSLIIQQGGTINTNFTNVPPNVTTTFVVKKAVGE